MSGADLGRGNKSNNRGRLSTTPCMWLLLPSMLVGLITGIALGALAGPSIAPGALTICVVWLLSSLAALALRRRGSGGVVAALTTVALGVLVSEPPPTPSLPAFESAPYCTIAVERTSLRADGWVVTGRLVQVRASSSGAPVEVDARVAIHRVRGVAVPIRGDLVSLRASLRMPGGPLHEFAFDPQKYARATGIAFTGTAESEIVLLSLGRGPLAAIDRLRVRLERSLVTRLPEQEAGVLLAIVTGDKSRLDPELRAAFAANGAAHVLAVSGLHLGILCVAVFGVMKRVAARLGPFTARLGAERIASMATLPLVVGYVLLTGSPASAVRAGLMASIVLIGVMNDRRPSSVHALCAAAFAMLVTNPAWLFDVGFQLSVTATGSLILTPKMSPRSVGGRLWEALRISMVASLATAPVLLWHFGTMPLMSPFTNLVVVPPIALVALPAALIGASLDAFGLPGAGPLIALAGLAVRIAVGIASWGAPVLEVAIAWGRPAGFGILGWSWVALWAPAFGVVSMKTHAFLVATSLALVAPDAPRPQGDLRVHSIPIGQGDCTLIESGVGRILVDAGGSRSSSGSRARRAILPYLAGQGVGRLDVVVISHADLDHAGDVAELIRWGRPEEVWVPAGQESAATRRAARAAAEVGARWRVLRVPIVRTRGTTVVAALPPMPGLGRNDGGLVVRACERSVCALLTGDIEAPREEMLLSLGRELRADYLKVPHHGSRTSSTEEFLDAVRPRVAVAHVGRANRFGFPHPEVVARYSARAIRFRRTDQGSAHVWVTDGQRSWEEPAYTLRR